MSRSNPERRHVAATPAHTQLHHPTPLAWCSGSDALLVAGSSLTVMSGLRFARQMAKQGKPIVVINHGATRADDLATVRLDIPLSDALAELCGRI